MKNQPKILTLDIETAPAIVYTWNLWDVTIGINQIIHDPYMLMWSAKWLHEKNIMWDAVYKHADPSRYSTRGEKAIAKSIRKLINQADIIVTHNGDKFDIKWLNSLFANYDLPPVSNFKSIDTCKEAGKIGYWISKKLAYLTKKFKLGNKIDTGGFELWIECMKGEMASWQKMVKYCIHDTRIDERLYKKLRPYIKSHPNLNLYRHDGVPVCTNCGCDRLTKDGYAPTKSGIYQRFRCVDCGKPVRGEQNLVKKLKGTRGVVSAL